MAAPCSASFRNVAPRSAFLMICPATGALPSAVVKEATPGPPWLVTCHSSCCQWCAVMADTGKPPSASSMAGCSTCGRHGQPYCLQHLLVSRQQRQPCMMRWGGVQLMPHPQPAQMDACCVPVLHCGQRASQQRSSTASHLHSITSAQHHICTASHLHSSASAQQRSSRAHLLESQLAPLAHHVFPQRSSAWHCDGQRAAGGQLAAADARRPDGLQGEAGGGRTIAKHAAHALGIGVVEQGEGVATDAWCTRRGMVFVQRRGCSRSMRGESVVPHVCSVAGARVHSRSTGVLCCAVLCCAVLCCAVLCCAVLCPGLLGSRQLVRSGHAACSSYQHCVSC